MTVWCLKRYTSYTFSTKGSKHTGPNIESNLLVNRPIATECMESSRWDGGTSTLMHSIHCIYHNFGHGLCHYINISDFIFIFKNKYCLSTSWEAEMLSLYFISRPTLYMSYFNNWWRWARDSCHHGKQALFFMSYLCRAKVWKKFKWHLVVL